jgi:hypothetical protein
MNFIYYADLKKIKSQNLESAFGLHRQPSERFIELFNDLSI